MAIEISGKLIKLLPLQTGSGKNGTWNKQDFIIETTEQYPKKICISAWGDKINMLAQFSLDSSLKVSVNIESREYNGKWYTDLRAWKIEAFHTDFSDNVSPDTVFTDNQTYNENLSDGTFYDEGDTMDNLPF